MTAPPRDLWADRIRPFLAGLSSAAVVMLAFLVPSMQDLWDRYESRHTVDRFETIGRQLMQQEKYTAAEQAFERALELGGNQRYDLLEWKLKARVQRVLEDREWAAPLPDDLEESDFLYLIELERESRHDRDRAMALTAYAHLLVEQKRWAEASSTVREAVALDPRSADAQTTLGNILADQGQTESAERAYRAALAIDPSHEGARYDLGLLLRESGRAAQSVEQFRLYTTAHPADFEGFLRLAETLRETGDAESARQAVAAGLRLDPTNAEVRAAAAQLAMPMPDAESIARRSRSGGSTGSSR